MTDIDTGAGIDIVWREQEVVVRIPLAGGVPEQWSRRYDELARRQGLPAQAQEDPGRGWLVVTMPASVARPDIRTTLDAARSLIPKADASEESPNPERAAATIREWWADQQD